MTLRATPYGSILEKGMVLFLATLSAGLRPSNDASASLAFMEPLPCAAPRPLAGDLAALPDRPPADFVVTANGNQQWVVNGVVNPTLTLVRGQAYTFDLASITDEHPFLVNLNPNNPFGPLLLGPTYGTTVTFTPDFVMPSSIYYHCEVHYGSMAGSIILVPPPVCVGDLNNDDAVNSTDFGIFVSAYGTTCACAADLNGSGAVNSADFALFVSAFGSPCL